MKMQHCLLTLGLVLATTGFAEEEKKPADGAAMPKITFDDHVLPIFRAKCASCHSADQAKGDLVVDNYAALMRGGASGEVVTAGDLDDSRLWALVTHAEEPIMPPKEPKLPDEMLNTLKAWIEGGALEKSSSTAKV
ncbi:MAG: c-type cytochrome, partial [Planctomycetaceae bacterium]|nr:c-type cytochrome [Planctomycetaceae bacterium]